MKTSSGKSKQKSLKTLQTSLVSEAKKLKYNLETSTSAIKARNKTVVSKTFHKAGIVVPVINEVGYRPLTMTDGEFEVVILTDMWKLNIFILLTIFIFMPLILIYKGK